MAPRPIPSLSQLAGWVRDVPAGEPWSVYLGHHRNGAVRYDGTLWSLHPMLIDGPAHQVAYERAMATTGCWMPEHAEQYRTIAGEPHCSHNDVEQFLLLLRAGLYGARHGYWRPDAEEVESFGE